MKNMDIQLAFINIEERIAILQANEQIEEGNFLFIEKLNKLRVA